MLTIEMPDSPLVSVAFQPEAEYRRVLGPGTTPPWLEPLSVVTPVVVPLTAHQAYTDPRVAEYFASQADAWRFSLVRLACGFAAAPDEPITMAVLEVALTPAAGASAPSVIDMDPSKLADDTQVKRDLKAGVSIEYAGAKLGFTGERGEERPSGDLFLVAGGVGQPRVGWEITELPGMKIGGIMVFNLIVKTAVGQAAQGQMTVTAQVRRKKFGLIPYRALLDDHPTGQFVCPA